MKASSSWRSPAVVAETSITCLWNAASNDTVLWQTTISQPQPSTLRPCIHGLSLMMPDQNSAAEGFAWFSTTWNYTSCCRLNISTHRGPIGPAESVLRGMYCILSSPAPACLQISSAAKALSVGRLVDKQLKYGASIIRCLGISWSLDGSCQTPTRPPSPEVAAESLSFRSAVNVSSCKATLRQHIDQARPQQTSSKKSVDPSGAQSLCTTHENLLRDPCQFSHTEASQPGCNILNALFAKP